jgi:anti-sigma-K factor RskA
MHSATENHDGKDKAELLVPWYVAGKLEDDEAREVEELAYSDPEFAKLIEEAKREAEAIATLNEAAGNPSSALWARIEESVEQERQVRSHSWLTDRFAHVTEAVSSFFAGLSVPQWQALAAAAVAICVAEAGAIAYLAGSGGAPATFHAASGPKTQASAVRAAFIVSFKDTATVAEINKALGETGTLIVDGPNTDNLYRLGLRNDNVAARDQAYAKLLASGLVSLILPEK